MTEHQIMKPTWWLWVIGCGLLAAVGVLLVILFMADGFEVLISGIAGIIFLG